MSKKQQRRERQQAEQAAVRQQQVSPAPVVKQDDSLNLAKSKVATMIKEIVGVAETHKEFLEAAVFARRFNLASMNYYPSMNFEAAVASDGVKAPRKVDVYWQGNVIASWEPGSHRNGFEEPKSAGEEFAEAFYPTEQEPAAAQPEPVVTPEPVAPAPAPEPVTQPEPVIPPADAPKPEQEEPKGDGEQQPPAEEQQSGEQSEQTEKTAEELAAEEEAKKAQSGEQSEQQ